LPFGRSVIRNNISWFLYIYEIVLQVPEKTRTAPRTQKPDDLFVRWHIDWRPLSTELAPMALAKEVKMMEWRCFALNAGRFDAKKCTLFLGNLFCCLLKIKNNHRHINMQTVLFINI
jgi:hypothetical protein